MPGAVHRSPALANIGAVGACPVALLSWPIARPVGEMAAAFERGNAGNGLRPAGRDTEASHATGDRMVDAARRLGRRASNLAANPSPGVAHDLPQHVPAEISTHANPPIAKACNDAILSAPTGARFRAEPFAAPQRGAGQQLRPHRR